jgi:hypothetical protein
VIAIATAIVKSAMGSDEAILAVISDDGNVQASKVPACNKKGGVRGS